MFRISRARAASAALVALLAITACSHDRGDKSVVAYSPAPHVPVPVEVEGIHNAFWLGPELMSGSQPEGEIAFESLAKHGIKTLISVDGAAPDAETAAKHGIRTVHLPIGYDGMTRERQVELVRAAKDLPGPIFVHCHHGKHRGPTAAAIIAMGDDGWTVEEAAAAQVTMGTAAEYAGLYACVAEFTQPTAKELKRADDSFPTRSPVSDMAEAMVHIDERWESLKVAKASEWTEVPGHPDVVPAHEALMVREVFTEWARPEFSAPDDFKQMNADMEKAAADLESAIRAGDTAAANAAFAAGNAACKACHVVYRNTSPVRR